MTDKVVDMGSIDIGYEQDNLLSVGLGSCIGVALYDPVKKIGGLAHVMLPNSAEIPTRTSERKALIAEKDNRISSGLKDMLSRHDFIWVKECENHEQMMRVYKESRPSILLISAFLPPKDGMDAMKSVLHFDKNAEIVILSPALDNYTLNKYIDEGAKEVLVQTFNEEKVLTVVNSVLERTKLKFADVAIRTLVHLMVNRGAKQENLIAKMVGGAHMFPTLMDEEVINIGNRNIHAAKKTLEALNIKLEADETGGNIGRTIIFEVRSGKVKLRTKDGMHEI